MSWQVEAIVRVSIVIGGAALCCATFAAEAWPQPDGAFKGKIAASVKDSTPDWPQPIKAPKDAPNIVLILLDDVGFADTSTFGGVAQTPELDKLAAQGLRYDNFNTTAMCSPTRAALLSGRNHHRVGFGIIADDSGGFPGYDSIWKKSTVSFPEVLRRNGYSTAAFGKWHNTPDWEISPLGPFDRWPTGLGFESFYGFMAGWQNEWEPSTLYRDTTPVEAPATPEQGYHLTTDIVDQSVRWMQTHHSIAPEKPYFLYLATGAAHVPHQAPKKWIDEYRGKFDRGWDELNQDVFARQKQLGVIPANAELTPRPAAIPAWDSLTADQKKLYARQMEVYAGFIAHTDHEVGRLLKAVQSGPDANNTLILYIVGDNGAADGGTDGFTDGMVAVGDQLKHIDELGGPSVPLNCYARGWTWLGSTPFKGWKTIASHFGGVRDPLVVSWPARIEERGGLRTQFTHVNDVAATIYEVTGIRMPSKVDGIAQQPLDGVSFARTFDHPAAPSRHHTQYFELYGNRAIYQDGWVAAARHGALDEEHPSSDYGHDRWELYHVADDFSEAHDLAAQNHSKLAQLQRLFDAEARKNDVYPLGGAGVTAHKPSWTEGAREFTYVPGIQRIPLALMPPLTGTSFSISAKAVIPEGGARGVIVAYGARGGGFSLYIKDGRLHYENKLGNGEYESVESDIPVPEGEAVLAYEFVREGERKEPLGDVVAVGTGRLSINGREVGKSKLSGAAHVDMGVMGIGREFGSPVSDAFRPPFAFSGGVLQQVKVELH